MNTREIILQFIADHGEITGQDLTKTMNMTRQAVHKYLKPMIEEGRVIKIGKTRAATYRLADTPSPLPATGKVFRKRYPLEKSEEHLIFDEFSSVLNLRKEMKQNVYDIFQYAFTEVMNNAIEHSASKYADVEISVEPYNCAFRIRDYGVGIFFTIFKKFGLPDENEAVLELMKGKKTTMADRHAGEGVFFTSRSGDRVIFQSHRIRLLFDNISNDVMLQAIRLRKGTEVAFSISKKSRRELSGIFNLYSPEEYEYRFEKTEVRVRLFQRELVSRSEARRIMSQIHKFKEVILDFKDVTTIGQAFADEIFRVFGNQHPDVLIRVENLNPSLKPMIDHARQSDLDSPAGESYLQPPR
jgi:biotin operon repressor/anti-sigma regulatory factor (Ser/Thr protein kinase)